jgi:hypothetical protein
MTGYINNDGSMSVGGLLPSGVGEGLQLDAAGNLKVTGAGTDTSATGTVTLNNDATSIVLPGGLCTALVQILGTFVGTLNFEASPDSGTTWYAIQGNQVGTSTIATTTTSVGAWRFNIAGFTTFRVRFSPVTSGTANITIRLSQQPYETFMMNASPLGQTVMANSSPVVLPSDQIVPTNLKQINGAALSASNPDIVEANIQNWIRLGQGFNGTSGTSSTAGAINAVEFSLFNPAASGKNIYVYSLKVVANITGNFAVATLITTDPALTAAAVTNLKPGSGASAASVTYSSAAQTQTGTVLDRLVLPGNNAVQDFFMNGAGILLPAASAYGIAVFINLTAAANWTVTARWIEF